MAHKVYNLQEKLNISTLKNITMLKHILHQWYDTIKWDIDLSNQNIESLNELRMYAYGVKWKFDCSNNNLTSFKWFPKDCTQLRCTGNKINSMFNIPSTEDFEIDNSFSYMEEMVEWSIYRYWKDYFIVHNDLTIRDREMVIDEFNWLISFDKTRFQLTENDKVLSNNNIKISLPDEKYPKSIVSYSYLLENTVYKYHTPTIWNVIQFRWKKYLPIILTSDFYKNWGDIKTKEISYPSGKVDIIKVNWKLYNKNFLKPIK